MAAVTEMTNWAVDLIDVRKTYGRSTHALKGVNIQVGRGEIFGLLGPNGAGKSTLVKIMMTAVRPTRALGTILGRPLGHRGKLGVMGYLPEDHRFPRYLTGYQVLDYYATLARVPRSERRSRAKTLLDRVWLTQWAHRRVSEYSKGMLQRLGIAQALMNDPELIVLDEPTDGLDPVGRRDVRELLLELRDQRKTIFLNSHLLSELEMVCDRVSILVDGNVARQGTLKELTSHTLEYDVEISDSLPPALSARVEALGARIAGRQIRLAGNSIEKVNELIDLLRSERVLISRIDPKHFSLEDVLVEAIGTPTAPGSVRSDSR